MIKISIITPTNNPVFLKELEDTILAQSYENWEWVILLNGGAKYEASGIGRQASGEIKIIDCPFVNNNVGFLKRLACMNATGDVIAEVDHDDLLTMDCLEKVVKAFEDPEVGFVFSRNAKLSDNFRPYLAEYGWEHSFFRWNGRKLFAMHNQPVYPGRLGHIWFAPDHIRAWRRDVYENIGGHDDSLAVCDDLDLMHRLYKVTKFREIQEVLYVYRINGNNTFIKNGQAIRELSDRLYDHNIEGLAERFCELNGLSKGDLSTGHRAQGPELEKEFIGVPDNSFGLIVARDLLQFVKDKDLFMTEVHRVLAPGGMLISETPSTDGRGAFQDPGALSFWNENTFWYYTRQAYVMKRRQASGAGHQAKPGIMFRECKLTTKFRDENDKENKTPYVIAHLEKLILTK